MLAGEQLAHPLLVRRVGVAVQQHHGHALDVLRRDRPRGGDDRRFVQFLDHLAARVQASADLPHALR